MEEEELSNLCQYVRNSLPLDVILVDIFSKINILKNNMNPILARKHHHRFFFKAVEC